ncbi:MAG TPA: DPP IV N-terminal domain-containing protein [Gemmataceae bacterium]
MPTLLCRCALLWTFFLTFNGLAAAQEEPLQTIAESSDFKATSRHADVIAFGEALAKRSTLVRLGELGVSGEGRKIPLIIVADPPVATPEEAVKSGKLVVLINGNIHAGEVDGKEALLMLARDIATAKERPLLKDLILVFCPIFNPDGNEKIDRAHRPEQNGPADGVGIRENAAGYDLNRDFVKLETPEVRALVRAFNKWDPAVFIDAHTTNGSKHRYPLTYDGPRHPASPQGLVEFVRDRALPAVGERLEKEGYKSFWYGNFSADRTRWETYGAQPRFGISYMGMRGRLAVLSESYTYASYRERVMVSRSFIRSWLEYIAEHKDEVRKLIKEAKPPEKIALRGKAVPLGDKWTVLGFEEEMKDGKRIATDKPKDYSLQFIGKIEPTVTVTAPFAYLFPASYTQAIEVLQRHGVTVEELREDIDLNVTVYRADKVVRAEREYQKHKAASVEATGRQEERRIPAGMILVRTSQKLGTLAAFLLEPEADDSLTTWNFFDEGVAEGKDFPVLRVNEKVALTAGPVRPLTEERKSNKPFNADMLLKGPPPNLNGNPTSVLGWLDDGEHFLQIKNGELHKVHARSGKSQTFVDAEKLTKSLQALDILDADAIKALARGPAYRMNPQHTGMLTEQGNDFYLAFFDGKPVVRLTKSAGPKENASFSPDGKFVAFIRNGNLYTVDVATQSEKALTTDGGGAILNGKADWVYGEEIFYRRGHAYWWSPDSKHIAFLRFNDEPVHKFTVLQELPTRQKVEATPYPKAGDPNPHVSLGVVSVGGGEVAFPDLGDYSPTDSLICHVGWLPDGKKLYFYVQNRAQTWLDFCTAWPRGGAMTRLFRETTKAWVDDPGEATFLKDGSFLLASERTGWRHIYHFDKEGKLIRPVTSGDWEVRALHHVDEENGRIYVSGTKDSPIAVNLYRCRLDGSGLERLTKESGNHQIGVTSLGERLAGNRPAGICPKGDLFVDVCSNFTTPTQVRLYSTDGTLCRTLDTNPVYAREEYRFGTFEHVEIKLPDGFVLEGTLTKPPDFETSKQYPVWFMTYAGPHAPVVHDGWEGGRVFDQALAGMGFIVFHCDPRSASGKGACSTWAAYKQLGVQELKDIEGALDWLCANPWVDAKRIGMSGGSYGGFMTLYAMTHSKRFAAGVASAPVTDWHNYDSIYTERYMNTPQENPEGYAKTSVVKAAKNLHGKVLIQHGVMDDNVHMQNTLQLMDALQKADKDFEVMFYPVSRHGGFGKHSQRQMIEFIVRTLGEKKAEPATSATESGR